MIGGRSSGRPESSLNRELLFAMESARSRLAVAIATENKATPRPRWLWYLETEDRMRRCVREIRRLRTRGPDTYYEWLEALILLKQPLSSNDEETPEAQIMCRRMVEVLAILERADPGLRGT